MDSLIAKLLALILGFAAPDAPAKPFGHDKSNSQPSYLLPTDPNSAPNGDPPKVDP